MKTLLCTHTCTTVLDDHSLAAKLLQVWERFRQDGHPSKRGNPFLSSIRCVDYCCAGDDKRSATPTCHDRGRTLPRRCVAARGSRDARCPHRTQIVKLRGFAENRPISFVHLQCHFYWHLLTAPVRWASVSGACVLEDSSRPPQDTLQAPGSFSFGGWTQQPTTSSFLLPCRVVSRVGTQNAQVHGRSDPG